MNLDFKIIKRPLSAESIARQFAFGTSVGINKTVKEGQQAVITQLRHTFTIRNNWLERSPIAIKAKFSNKNQNPIVGEIYTKAQFLPRQEEGGIKIPYRHYLAMPADTGPLNKAKVIPSRLRPANLPNAFILTTKSGTKLLCVRKSRGKNKGIVPYYVLIPKAHIKKVDIFEVPIRKVVDRRLALNIAEGIDNALKTAK